MIRRRVDSYNSNDLKQWLISNPEQSITIEYNPTGFSVWNDDRVWKATLKLPIGSKLGWITQTIEELIYCICTNAD